MAWLIIRVCGDRQGKNTFNVLRGRSKLCTPKRSDVARLAEKFGVEAHIDGGIASHKEWPWSVVAYTSRSRDGIGRSGGQYVSLMARPKRREAQLRERGQ